MKTKRLKKIVIKESNQTLDELLNPEQLNNIKGGKYYPPQCPCYGPGGMYCDVKI